MTSSLTHRLESWRALLRYGGPDWLVEHAPRIIAELEAELAAQRIEAGTDETPTAVQPEGREPGPKDAPDISISGEAYG